MTEAVVDDLEPIEIQIEHRERIAGAPRRELVETAAEPLDENPAIDQSGQRVEEADAAQPFLGNRLVGRVGE